MVQFLVEHGACIFATTFSDQELASDKCEEDEEGYDSCSQYLRGDHLISPFSNNHTKDPVCVKYKLLASV